jgi:hypothetical protein
MVLGVTRHEGMGCWGAVVEAFVEEFVEAAVAAFVAEDAAGR